LTGQLKGKCIELLQKFVGDFQEVSAYIILPVLFLLTLKSQRKAKVTEADIDAFMDSSRKIEPTFGKSAQASSA
jgi:tryptophanyl-tRNA synthetase